MSKKKYVLQENIKDCAVACLYNIIRYYDGYISMDKLRNKLNTNKDGTSVYDIVKTSNELGLKSSAYECELNDLCNLNLPLIAHMKVEGKFDHFVIIDKIIDDEIIIFDPIRGYLKYDLENFENQWSNIIIIFEKTNNLVKEQKLSFIYNIIIHLLKNSYVILIVFFISILSSFLSVLHSLYLSYLYKQNNFSINLFYLFILICILKLFIDYIRNKKILNYTKKFDINITEKTYKKILSLPLIYHHTRPVGDIVSRINDLSSIKEFINNISFSFIIDFTYVLLISIILFIINKLLFILLFIMTVIYIIIYLIYRKIIVNQSYIVKEHSSKTSTYLIETLFGIDTIKNTNIEEVRINNFNKEYKDFLDKQFNLNKLIINLNLLQDFISNITLIFITFVSIVLFKKNIISFSYVLAFTSLMIYYFI